MTASAWAEDHEPIDSPGALFRHLSEDHDLAEAHDLDPVSAPVRFWLRRHADLHAPDRAALPETTSRRAAAAPADHELDHHDASHEDVRAMTAPASPPATAPQGKTGRAMRPAQPTVTPAAAGKPTRTPRGVRAGWRWLVRLLRGYLLAAALLLGAVLAFTPAPGVPLPGYRLDVTNATAGDGGPVEAAGVLALRAAGSVTGQAADRQGELLTDHPLATRLLTPAAVSLHGWIQPHRLPIAIGGTLLLAALIFMGVYGLPGRHADDGGRVRLGRRWWLLGVTLTLLTTAVVCFPAPALSAANAPGVLVARQAVNFTANRLLPPGSLDAAQAQSVQARLAQDYWTQFVTNPVSRRETRSSILVHTPAQHRGEVTAFLHARGVQPATGLHGAVISTSGLASAALGAVVIGGAAWLALAAQAALLMLLVVGLWLVPVWCASGQVQRLILWWLLPLAVLTLLVAVGALASVAATRSAATLAWVWELLSDAVTGAAVATGLFLLAVWRVRRRVRRWRARRADQSQPAAESSRRPVGAGKAGAAA